MPCTVHDCKGRKVFLLANLLAEISGYVTSKAAQGYKQAYTERKRFSSKEANNMTLSFLPQAAGPTLQLYRRSYNCT